MSLESFIYIKLETLGGYVSIQKSDFLRHSLVLQMLRNKLRYKHKHLEI